MANTIINIKKHMRIDNIENLYDDDYYEKCK